MATQMVRNASRLASVCLRLTTVAVISFAGTSGRAWSRTTGCATALESEVVIPNSTEDGASIADRARQAPDHHDDAIAVFCLEVKPDFLPIVYARRQRCSRSP